ncbi:MAG TPA: TonB-dependent receptor plug domain-containing protein [Gemmatimonadaceae bacterium]|nr:TonB-dependent receptor plug domain-containing protein [Gemmatimonadaceae bacterium]
MRRTIRLLLLPLIVVSCTRQTGRTLGADRDVITEEEIATTSAITAYEVVQKLRGNFLSNRGKTTILGRSSPLPMVYLDGVRYGELASLRNISATIVQSIRLYRAWDAQQRYGNDVTGGVIEVTTKK